MARGYLRLRAPRPGAPPPRRAKRLLFKAGKALPEPIVYAMLGMFNYIHLGWWIKRRSFRVGSLVDDRERVFDCIAAAVRGRSVLYLEFGVAFGNSMRYWSRLLERPDSMLHGFDSFEGLPSGWAPGWPAGAFSDVSGPPKFDDQRVELFSGWFTETLPNYEWPDGYEQLIVTLDADLYSSTAYVLQAIEPRITVGTVLYFDEFHHYADELRAFDELVQRTQWEFEILAATRDFSQVAFRRVA
jgi:Macrocin-O-methyltransferase (TylF)